jgi:hypothetical protein
MLGKRESLFERPELPNLILLQNFCESTFSEIFSVSYKPERLEKPGQNFAYNSISSPHSCLVVSSKPR